MHTRGGRAHGPCQGVAAAQFALGLHLRDGVGVGRSAAEACEWFRRASAQGHALASFEWGRLLEEGGPGVTSDGLPNVRAAKAAFEAAAATVRKRVGTRLCRRLVRGSAFVSPARLHGHYYPPLPYNSLTCIASSLYVRVRVCVCVRPLCVTLGRR